MSVAVVLALSWMSAGPFRSWWTNEYGWPWAFFWLGFAVLFWGSLIAILIWAVRSVSTSPRKAAGAAKMLKRRLAAGELSREEYDHIRRLLEDAPLIGGGVVGEMNAMTKGTPGGKRGAGLIIRVLVFFDTIALLFAAGLHINGASIPLGAAVFNEPQIVPAAIVEGLAGVAFAVSAYAIVDGKIWAWSSAMVAHIFAILGFIVGLIATSGGTSPFNFTYHRVMLVIFALGLILLLLPASRAALGQGGQKPQKD